MSRATAARSARSPLCFNRKKFDESATWYEKLILVDPDNSPSRRPCGRRACAPGSTLDLAADSGGWHSQLAYMNLIWRAKAHLEDSKQDYEADFGQADAWFQKVLDTRQAKAGRQP